MRQVKYREFHWRKPRGQRWLQHALVDISARESVRNGRSLPRLIRPIWVFLVPTILIARDVAAFKMVVRSR